MSKNPHSKISYQSTLGWIHLFEAICLKNNTDIFKIVSLGVDVNTRDNLGRNALYWAIKMNNFNALKILVHVGLDFHSDVEKNVTPLAFAKKYGSEEVLSYIEELMLKLKV